VGERKGHCTDHMCLQGHTIYDSKYRIYIKPICPWGLQQFGYGNASSLQGSVVVEYTRYRNSVSNMASLLWHSQAKATNVVRN
jgi:hypothetical protein